MINNNKSKINVAVLASGGGTNLQAIIDNKKQGKLDEINLKLVISNKKNAYALVRAQNNNIESLFINPKSFNTSAAYDEYIVQTLKERDIDLVLLAGYLKILTDNLLKSYDERILNIHPSLLPAFGGHNMYGMRVHEAVIKSAVKESGCTVHVVTKEIDAGPIIDQEKVIVTPKDTAHSLALKVLEKEHILYPRAIKKFIHQTEELKSHVITA